MITTMNPMGTRTKEMDSSRTSSSNEVLDSVQRLIPIIERVRRKDLRRAGLRKMLFDETKILRLLPGFKAIKIIRELGEKNGNSEALFDALNAQIRVIEGYSPTLGAAIKEELQKENQFEPIVQRVISIFLTYPKERVFQHFETYKERYLKHLDGLPNKELREALLGLIKTFLAEYAKRQEQTKQLDMFKAAIDRWQSNRPIDEYIKEANKILMELGSLKDKQIDLLIKNTNVRNILTYKQELGFLSDLLRRVLLAFREEADTWRSFRQVYSNMGKIIKALSERYYDPETASELEACFKDTPHYGEQPIPWRNRLQQIIIRLRQQGRVIEKAKTSLLKILGLSINRLKEVSEEGFQTIKGRIQGIGKKIRKIPIKSKSVLNKKVREEEQRLRRDLEEIRSKYDAQESICFGPADKFNRLVGELKDFIELESKFMKRAVPLAKIIPSIGERAARSIENVDLNNPDAAFAYMSRVWEYAAYENEVRSRIEPARAAMQQGYIDLPLLMHRIQEAAYGFERMLDPLIVSLTSILKIENRERVAGDSVIGGTSRIPFYSAN